MGSRFDRFYSRPDLAFGDRPTEALVAYVRAGGIPGGALDLGCGDGRNALYLAAAGYRVTAIDCSEVGVSKLTRIARGRRLGDRVAGIVGDVRDWILQPLPFDLVVAVTILDHLPAADIDPLLGRIAASTRPGGTALIQVHTVDDPGYHGPAARGASEQAGAIEHYFRRDELRARLSKQWRVEHYEERMEHDTCHGRPHDHGFAIARCVKTT